MKTRCPLCGLAVLLGLLLLFLVPLARPQETPTDTQAWSLATVRVTGSATTSDDPSTGVGERRLAAQREAKLDALRKLTVEVHAAVTDSGATVGDLVAANETLRGPVDAFIQGARITATRFLRDGLVEVDMEIELKALPVILGQGK